MILAVLSCLFIFLGMFIGERFDFKKLSINVIFGLFTLNCLVSIIPYAYSYLYRNYHGSTFFYVLLSIVLGYLLIKLINYKYDDCDNISIVGFTFANTALFIFHRFSFLFLIINILYYILLGIYISKSKSWVYVLFGCIFAILSSLLGNWIMGYFYGISIGFVIYFILSVYNIVFRSNNKDSYTALVIGFIVALIGGLL